MRHRNPGIAIMRRAANATPPERKTLKEWAAQFRVTPATVAGWSVHYRLQSAVLRAENLPLDFVRAVDIRHHKNHYGVVYPQNTAYIRARALRAAGLGNETRLRYRIDPIAKTITLSAVET